MAYAFNDRRIAEELKQMAEANFLEDQGSDTTNDNDTIYIMTGVAEVAARTEDTGPPVVITATEAEGQEYSVDMDGLFDEIPGQDPTTFFNGTAEAIPAETLITVTRIGAKWIYSSGAVEPTQRLRFVLTEAIQRAPGVVSGRALATVIDSGNTTLAVDTVLTVNDPNKEFCFSAVGSIGWATKGTVKSADGPPVVSSEEWVIESCTQLINKVVADCDSAIAPWDVSTPAHVIDGIESMSYWPYILTHPSEVSVIDPAMVINSHRFTANPGRVWLERREVLADEQSIDEIIPYTATEPVWEWHITDVEYPTARWVQVKYDGSELWSTDAPTPSTPGATSTKYFEGFNPNSNSLIAGYIAPAYTSGLDTWCAIETNIKGLAFLDDTTGNYIVSSTMSAYYGEGKKVRSVAVLTTDGLEGDLIEDDTSDPDPCGKGKYKELINMVAFGNPDVSNGCPLEQTFPQPKFDLLSTATDLTVVTNAVVDINGDIQMETETIKACSSPGADIAFPLATIDLTVLNSVGCSGTEFKENYTTYSVVGTTGASGSNTVDTSCVISEIDYTTIINYPVYPYIDYYDLIWPEGCNPCDVAGCCTITYSVDPTSSQTMTSAQCTAVNGTGAGDSLVTGVSWSATPCVDTVDPMGCCLVTANPDWHTTSYEDECILADIQTLDPTATAVSWSAELCGIDPCGCCSAISIDAFVFAQVAFEHAGGCSIGFNSTSVGSNDGTCTWVITGTWDYVDPDSPASAAGTMTLSYDESTNTWSITGTPSEYGMTITGSVVVDSCDGGSPADVIDIPITGTSQAGSYCEGSYSGTVRVTATAGGPC
tara:strand:+ start:3634 stop:6105 length:2472 start_codon:yes stop_codon:yes gene_type:complete